MPDKNKSAVARPDFQSHDTIYRPGSSSMYVLLAEVLLGLGCVHNA